VADSEPGQQRRLRYEAIERWKRRKIERLHSLRAQLEGPERVSASNGRVLVTDRRIIFADYLYRYGHPIRDETRDAIAFDEIRAWAVGRRHDERPLIRLEHEPHVRVEWVPAHRFLRFRWGNATGPVTHGESTLSFNRRSDPALRAIAVRLEADAVPRGDNFVITLKGTREERGGSAVLYGRGS
jgi:hypothetical protein